MAKGFKIEGMKELERAFKELGKVPQSTATKSARAGTTIGFKAAKANAPVDSGDLKSGIIMKKERRTVQGKAVYDVMMDPAKNDIFAETSKDGERSYYPASQEYGFLTVDGGYVPGYRFFKRSIAENARVIEKKMVDVAAKDIDKAWRG